jgi:hypothetical protein
MQCNLLGINMKTNESAEQKRINERVHCQKGSQDQIQSALIGSL